VVIDAVDDKGNFLNLLRFKAKVIEPDLQSRSMTIEQTAPGRYEGRFEATKVGNYIISVSNSTGRTSGVETNVVSIPYPPEYKDLDPNTTLLQRIASETGGRFNPPAQSIFRQGFQRSTAYTDLWRTLVLAAALLLPLDIAVRRLTLSTAEARQALVRLSERAREALLLNRKQPAAEEHPGGTVEKLLRTKPRYSSPQSQITIEKHGLTNLSGNTRSAESPNSDKAREKSSTVGSQFEGDLTSRLLEVKRRTRSSKPDG
ncbi:MAG: hypothetical protein QHI38_11080, partial [Armatimonadota bacterium]|nr:hypothetical protein [Armatimonadota bacterium]